MKRLFFLLFLAPFFQLLALTNDSFAILTYNVQTDYRIENELQTSIFLRKKANHLKEFLDTARPDLVTLLEVPLGGIQWLEKNYGITYRIIHAAKHYPHCEQKKNDYVVMLIKRSRFEPLIKSNQTEAIKTNYFSDNSGYLQLLVKLRDLRTAQKITFLATQFTKDHADTEGNEILTSLKSSDLAVVTADFSKTPQQGILSEFAKNGFVHLALKKVDGTTLDLQDTKNQGIGTLILYKASQRSRFLDKTRLGNDENSSSPLLCRLLLR